MKKENLKKELLKNAKKEHDFSKEKPSNKDTINKNTFLMEYIRSTSLDSVPDDMKDEMFDTIADLTEAKILASSNMFSYILAQKLEETLEKLFEGTMAMHGVMIQLIMYLREDITKVLSPEHLGILNVLHFGRKNSVLPTKKEIMDDMTDVEKNGRKSSAKIIDALLPGLINKVSKINDDIKEQSKSAGIYSVSNEALLKASVFSRRLDRLFLPMANETGAYAIRLKGGANDGSKRDALNEAIEEFTKMSKDEIKGKVDKMMSSLDFDDETKKENN